MKTLFLFITVFITTVNLAQKHTISVTITGFKNGTEVRLNDREAQVTIDKTTIVNNHFKFQNRIGDEIPISLGIVIISEGKPYGFSIFIANESINITGDKNDLPYNLKITGSKNYDEMSEKLENFKLDTENDKIVKFLKSNSGIDSIQIKILKQNRKLTEDKRKGYINSNPNSYASLYHLNWLKEEYSTADLQKLLNKLDKKHKECIYGERLINYIKVGNPLKKGDQFFDFDAIDQNGVKRKLSNFKGKYILLDFMEMGCKGCVMSIPELKTISSQYSDSLSVISFCVDKSKERWKETLKDSKTWTSLWDSKGPFSNTVLKYGVNAYPTFFLIDPEGKIVETFVGFGENQIATALIQIIK